MTKYKIFTSNGKMKRFFCLFFSLLFFSLLTANDVKQENKTLILRNFIVNYHSSPSPEKTAIFLRHVSENCDDDAMRSIVTGFCYELFKANPDKLKEWSEIIAEFKQRELRDTLIGLYPAAAGEKGEFLRRECYMKHRNKMGPEPRIALPTAKQLEQIAANYDPLFALGAYCASGKLKYPEAMLKYALSEKVDNKTMQNTARLCVVSLAMRDKNVRQMVKKYFKTTANDVKEKFFEDIPKQMVEKIFTEL